MTRYSRRHRRRATRNDVRLCGAHTTETIRDESPRCNDLCRRRRSTGPRGHSESALLARISDGGLRVGGGVHAQREARYTLVPHPRRRAADVNGLELQRQVADAQHPPIVFITGHGDIPSSVRAMKSGAIDYLPKPFSEEQILSAIEIALAQDRRTRHDAAQLAL